MASAAGTAARGPLGILMQSSLAQYSLLGGGVTYVLFPEKVQDAMAPYLMGLPLNSVVRSNASNSVAAPAVPQIIQIQTPASNTESNSSRSAYTVILYAGTGAAVCWIGYIICTTALPDYIQQYLPVTKAVFDKATQTLGKGLLNVKKVLEDKILGLSKKQDELSEKQDKTQNAVNGVSQNLDQARRDLGALADAMNRCEDSLNTTQDMQGYTLRGIKLLVKCVTSFIPQDNSSNNNGYLSDIDRYIRDGEHIHGGNNNTPTRQLHSEPPMARAHAIVPAIGSIPEDEDGILTPVALTPEPSSSSSLRSPMRRAYSAPKPRRSSNVGGPQIRPTRTKAVLYGSDSTPEIVDIQALLGH